MLFREVTKDNLSERKNKTAKLKKSGLPTDNTPA